MNKQRCCISGGHLHQSCQCKMPLSECKLKCNEDDGCKGYAAWHIGQPDEKCLYATSSAPCPGGCSLLNLGNVAPLAGNGTCGELHTDWVGCYMKVLDGIYTINTSTVHKHYCSIGAR